MLFSSLKTAKVANFDDHFFVPNEFDIPGPDHEQHPSKRSINVKDWLQCKEFPVFFTLFDDKNYFYCSIRGFNHCFCLSHTFGNIKSHLNNKHKQKNQNINADIQDNGKLDENISISEDINSIICSKLKKMILKTGKPFSMVNYPDMKSVLHFLGSRQELSSKSEMIAQKVKEKIKYLLITSSFISISVDEWSDLNKKGYLGITAKCIQDGNFSTYFLALRNIVSIHINGEELNDALNSILVDYGIEDRIMNAVSDNCNLMKNAFIFSSILRLPCACHLVNLFLKSFIRPSESILSEITSATRYLKSSVCYAALKYDYNDEPMVKNYNEIRWVSLFETFDSLQKSRSSIENFYLIEKSAGRDVKYKLYNRYWDFINLYLPILKTYKKAIEILESDHFGTIPLVHGTFNKIKKMIMRLPSSFKDNINSFKIKFDEQ